MVFDWITASLQRGRNDIYRNASGFFDEKLYGCLVNYVKNMSSTGSAVSTTVLGVKEALRRKINVQRV